MSENRATSLFRTKKIPTTHISQNHLDSINSAMEIFCESNKQYKWHCVTDNNRKIEASGIISYINKQKPKNLHYVVASKQPERELLLSIDNGITINLKNGSYVLYGLYSVLNDTLDIVKVPPLVVYLRRYWLLNIFLAGWFVPALILLMLGNMGGAVGWAIVYPIGIVFLFGAIASEAEEFINNLEWDDVVLPTKIQYNTYHVKVGSPILSILSSTKTMISIAASIVTIISFIFYLVQN